MEFKKWDTRKADYVTHHHEMSADAAIYKRRRNKITSLANGSKVSKCDAFIRSCLAYIRESRIHTIDEAVHTIGRNYTGKTVCTKTFYNWVNAGKIDGFARKDLPRAPGLEDPIIPVTGEATRTAMVLSEDIFQRARISTQ